MKWPWTHEAEESNGNDPDLHELTGRVEQLEEDVDRQKRDIRKIAVAVGIQSLDWWRKRDAG
jgi:hypothetical protein